MNRIKACNISLAETVFVFIGVMVVISISPPIAYGANEDAATRPFKNRVTFSFEDETQLKQLPSVGFDPSYIDKGALVSPIKKGSHKGLGRKFYFKTASGYEPKVAELEFDLRVNESFQLEGKSNEVGKLPGFEGIYDKRAGWGGKQVKDHDSWSIRIGHTGVAKNGEIPIGLYIYHPNMKSRYGTVVDVKRFLKHCVWYKIKLYVQLNDVGKSNGVIELSINDEQVYSSRRWILRKSEEVNIISAWLDAYIGGKTPSKRDTKVYIDNVNIQW